MHFSDMIKGEKGEIMELFQNVAEELGKEYQCFLDYLESNEVQLSNRTGHIGKKDWPMDAIREA